MSIRDRWCTFRVAGRLYGIEVGLVEEVLGPRPLTRLPLAPPVVQGVIQLRGRFLTAICLRRVLGFPPPASEAMSIVVRWHEQSWSLLVDAVEDMVVAEAAAFEAVPETVPTRMRALLRGVFKRERELLLALDVGHVLGLAQAEAPAAVPGSERR